MDSKFYITDCDIYHFYGDRPRDFFSLWVLKANQKVVVAPIKVNQYIDEPITTTIDALAKRGYQYVLM
jgi:hypothetical protein